jgi:hypothetical protein
MTKNVGGIEQSKIEHERRHQTPFTHSREGRSIDERIPYFGGSSTGNIKRVDQKEGVRITVHAILLYLTKGITSLPPFDLRTSVFFFLFHTLHHLSFIFPFFSFLLH